MKKWFLLGMLIFLNKSFAQNSDDNLREKFVLVIHGGAGTIFKSKMSPKREKAYTGVLNQALQAGYQILQKGGTAMDAAEACVRLLEDNPLFNVGKGAVFTNEGKNELDAAIMDGK